MGTVQRRNIYLHGAASDLVGAVRGIGGVLQGEGQAELARWLQLGTLVLLARIIDGRAPGEALDRVEDALTTVTRWLGPHPAALRGLAATAAIRRWWRWPAPEHAPRVVQAPQTTDAP